MPPEGLSLVFVPRANTKTGVARVLWLLWGIQLVAIDFRISKDGLWLGWVFFTI